MSRVGCFLSRVEKLSVLVDLGAFQMNKQVDNVLYAWGAEVAAGKLVASIPSQLGALIENKGVMHHGDGRGGCLSEVPVHLELSRRTSEVDGLLLQMFEDAAAGGLGSGRAASLWRLARVRYVVAPSCALEEQCALVGVAPRTYHNWLSALHEYLAPRLSECARAA